MAERENRRPRRNREEEAHEFSDRLVAINRVSKTVKAVSYTHLTLPTKA